MVQKSLCCTAFESIESANSLRFLWTALSIESAGLSIESVPFYRMAGFLGIPRKRGTCILAITHITGRTLLDGKVHIANMQEPQIKCLCLFTQAFLHKQQHHGNFLLLLYVLWACYRKPISRDYPETRWQLQSMYYRLHGNFITEKHTLTSKIT